MIRVTYDDAANAMYIYLTAIGPGGVRETRAYQPMDVDVDIENQIVALRLYESESLKLGRKLQHALMHPEVSFDEASCALRIAFARTYDHRCTFRWDANLDFDKDGQLSGIEILFASNESQVDLPADLADQSRDVKRLDPSGKLRRIEKYLIGFHKS